MQKKVIEIALAEVGYLEKSSEAYKKNPSVIYELTKGAGNDNITKYGHEMHKIYPKTMDFPAAWCDAFVDWCFYTAYGISTAKGLLGGEFDDYTVASAQLYKNKGAYHKGTSGIQPGDQVFFKNSKRIYHTGLCVAIDGKTIYIVEGNTSPQGNSASVVANGGGVFLKEYPHGYSAIDGYGRPPYTKDIKVSYPRWVRDDNFWYYRLSEGVNAKGWRLINHHWYYFFQNGTMATSTKTISSDKYGDEIYYFMTSGDYEGALCKSNDRGALVIWDV